MFDENMQLLIDGHHGIYVPQVFAETVKREYVKNVSQSDWDILLAGPDHEHYWDTWADVLDNAELISKFGNDNYRLWQDDDLFIYLPATVH